MYFTEDFPHLIRIFRELNPAFFPHKKAPKNPSRTEGKCSDTCISPILQDLFNFWI